MRKAFVDALQPIIRSDDRFYLLTGDLGYSLFMEFKDMVPERVINVGVAESNMIGIAAGLALCDNKVYCYSIIPFLTMRALEQVRVDLCYHNLDVVLLGSGAGYSYAHEGMTHHAIEDVSIMRSLPNMTVVAPGDRYECEELARQSAEHKGPIYVRLDTQNKPDVHTSNPDIKIGKGAVISEGGDITLIATGSMLHASKTVSESLAGKGYDMGLVSMHTVKPLDEELIKGLAKTTNAIFTIEEHSLIGGLGSAVAEVLADVGYGGIFKRIALPDEYVKVIGGREHLLRSNGLSPDLIEEKILKEVES